MASLIRHGWKMLGLVVMLTATSGVAFGVEVPEVDPATMGSAIAMLIAGAMMFRQGKK
jgi:hypothetical protein